MTGRNICVIGGGLMGMALARKLSLDKHKVTVVERDSQLGGLATWSDFGGFYWDRFYHVILPSDRNLIEFVRDLELETELEWQRTYTGFYVDKKMYSISSNMEFLRFPLLSIFSKLRLAWTMFYGSRLSNWRRLEATTVEDWLIRVSGRSTYEKLWKPLLLAKLGDNYKRVSAVFIWSYIKRLFSARDASASSEHLGHVRGGYQRIFSKLVEDIERRGGKIEVSAEVSAVHAEQGAGIGVVVDGTSRSFDKVICTSPVSVLEHIVDRDLLKIDAPQTGIEYLGVVCVVLVTRVPLVPYYVVNIADKSLPFTGLIGMTNVVSTDNTAGLHLTYLPKYLLSTHDDFRRSDEDFRSEFIAGIRQMLPNFDTDNIVSIHINRSFKVQPLQVLNYSSLVPSAETRHPDLYVVNTSQFVNATLNNNEVVGAVNRFYDEFSPSFRA